MTKLVEIEMIEQTIQPDHRLFVDGVEAVDVDSELHFRRMLYEKNTNKNADQSTVDSLGGGATVTGNHGDGVNIEFI